MIRNQKGFTLIELMVVVLIIGILVAIAIPVFGSAATNAKLKADKANLRTIDGAISQYMAENDVTPLAGAPGISQLVTSEFLKVEPKNPYTATADYTINRASDTSASAVSSQGTTY